MSYLVVCGREVGLKEIHIYRFRKVGYYSLEMKKYDYAGTLLYAKDLIEAKEKRVVGGDLVFSAKNLHIVSNPFWLWDWEYKNFSCHARQMIKRDVKLVLVREPF